MARLFAVSCVLCLATAGAAVAGDECVPVARVHGEPEVSSAVAREFAARAPEPEEDAANSCGVVDVDVSASGEWLRLIIRDQHGRTVERTADDPSAAATTIEAFVRRDIAAPLLDRRPAPARIAARPRAEVRAPPAQPTPAAVRERAVHVSAGPAVAVDSDRSLWTGVQMQGCVDIGWVCAGVRVQWSSDYGRTGLSSDLSTERSEFGLYWVGEVPLRWGALAVAPRAGLGYSSAEGERTDTSEDVDFQKAGLRVQAGVSAGYEIASDLSVGVDLIADIDPFSSPRIVTDAPAAMPVVAGVPTARGWLVLKLSYGGL